MFLELIAFAVVILVLATLGCVFLVALLAKGRTVRWRMLAGMILAFVVMFALPIVSATYDSASDSDANSQMLIWAGLLWFCICVPVCAIATALSDRK